MGLSEQHRVSGAAAAAGIDQTATPNPAPRLDRRCYQCYQAAMAQLIVRSIEDAVVAELRQRAARHGVSMEEEHRRILREALSHRGRGVQRSFKEHLAKMPNVGDDALFERAPARTLRALLMALLWTPTFSPKLRKGERCNPLVRRWYSASRQLIST
jgi:plasmid stability protein